MRATRPTRLFTLCCVLAAAFGCAAGEKAVILFGDDPESKPLAPALQNRLDRLLHQVKYARGEMLLKQLRELSAFGRYATHPVIAELLASNEPRLRAGAVFVLGEIDRLDGDPDARVAIRSALGDTDRTVRLEASRALLETGEKESVGPLIEALDDPQRGMRLRAYIALVSAAGTGFGYDVDGKPEQRQLAAERFRRYFAESGVAAAPAMTAPVAPPAVRPPAPEYEPLPIYGPQLPPGGLPTPPIETQNDPTGHID